MSAVVIRNFMGLKTFALISYSEAGMIVLFKVGIIKINV